MKYYVVRFLQLRTKTTPDFSPIVEYDTLDAAKKVFHTYMGSNINTTNTDVVYAMSLVFNSVGNVELMEKWEAPLPEPEPEEPTPEEPEEPENPEEATEG